MLDPQIIAVEILKLTPDDILVVTVPFGRTSDQCAYAQQAVELLIKKLGKENKVVVKTEGVKLAVQTSLPLTTPSPVSTPAIMQPDYQGSKRKRDKHGK
jgi:hypothetical protein